MYFETENESSEDFIEQCHENSEEYVPQIASFYPEPEEASMPTDFYSAIEAEKMKDVNWDMRPHFFDNITKSHLLLDSGAAVSAWPPDPGDKPDPKLRLRAVNGSTLRCYGYKEIEVQINRKRYPMRVVKTDVIQPVMGWDFQKKHRLTVDWTDWGDAIILDRRSGIQSILKYKAMSKNMVRGPSLLTPEEEAVPKMTKKEVSSNKIVFDMAAMAALTEETEAIISDLESMPEDEFKALIKKYPALLKLEFDDSEEPKNKVLHKIDTGSHQPCRSRVRRLIPGSHKAVEGHKAIQDLERLGIIERVDPNEANHWSSPVHFTLKGDGKSLRVVGDYRLLNQKTILDLYPLPQLTSFTDEIAGSTIFS